jgi:hypothetical protein
MTTPNLAGAVWRKSSRSDNNGGACVEVADLGAHIAVRDSKNSDRPALFFTREEWAAFVGGVRGGEFDV